MDNSTIVAYTVDDGFQYGFRFHFFTPFIRVKEAVRVSVSGLILLMSPLNIIVWDTRNSEFSIASGSRVFEHVSTLSVVPYISQGINPFCINVYGFIEFKEKLSPEETFVGTTDRVAFESACWSPFQSSSSPFLAIGVHSDMSVHFKILQPVWRFGSLEFREIASLMEFLRDQWFLIQLHTSTGVSCPITAEWPSISFCLEGHVQLCFVVWTLGNTLVTGWGCVLFLWDNEFKCIGALKIPKCDFSNIPLKSVSIVNEFDDGGFTIKCQSVRGVETLCKLSRINDIWNIEILVDSVDDPVIPTQAFEYTLRSSGRQIVQLVQTPVTDSLDSALSRFMQNPSWEYIRLIAQLYKPKKLSPFDVNNIFNSIIARFSLTFPSVNEDNYQLAFGLHTLHSRIDPIASSNPNARQHERSILLEKIGKECLSDGTHMCTFCGLTANEEKQLCTYCFFGILSPI